MEHETDLIPEVETVSEKIKSEPLISEVKTIDEMVEVWSRDLISNIPALRETVTYNKFHSAIQDLKSRLR
jgi:hypothetical protein